MAVGDAALAKASDPDGTGQGASRREQRKMAKAIAQTTPPAKPDGRQNTPKLAVFLARCGKPG